MIHGIMRLVENGLRDIQDVTWLSLMDSHLQGCGAINPALSGFDGVRFHRLFLHRNEAGGVDAITEVEVTDKRLGTLRQVVGLTDKSVVDDDRRADIYVSLRHHDVVIRPQLLLDRQRYGTAADAVRHAVVNMLLQYSELESFHG